MGNPPPLPVNSGASSNSGIFRQAATLSLVIPTLIGVASRFSLELGKAHPGPNGQLIMLGAAAVFSIAIFIGLAFGIAAATGASGKGSRPRSCRNPHQLGALGSFRHWLRSRIYKSPTLSQGLSEAAEEQKNLQRRLTQMPAIQ